jgi:hypothetical protein
MSFWGVLGTIGGVAATIATGGAAAPLIPVLSGVGNAVDAHNAEGKAAKQQIAAADKSAATLAPYNARGTQATNTLAGLLGMPDLPAGVGVGGQPTAARSSAGQTVLGQAVPRETAPANQGFGRLADLGGSTAAQAQTRSSYGPMVQLQSPDGEVGDVPAHEVEHWLKLGARPMGAVS